MCTLLGAGCLAMWTFVSYCADVLVSTSRYLFRTRLRAPRMSVCTSIRSRPYERASCPDREHETLGRQHLNRPADGAARYPVLLLEIGLARQHVRNLPGGDLLTQDRR